MIQLTVSTLSILITEEVCEAQVLQKEMPEQLDIPLEANLDDEPQEGDMVAVLFRNVDGPASVEKESKSQRCQKVLQGELYFWIGQKGEETKTEVSKEGNHITWNSPAVRIFAPQAPAS